MGIKNILSLSGGKDRRPDVVAICVLAGLWIVAAILVNPLGNFPLHDDFIYGKSVRQLIDTGRFHQPYYGQMNIIFQIYWGALFCLPFGFSFTALRMSTLALGLLGILATYGLLREIRARPAIALLGAALIALNPVYLGAANTFLTDVPFYSLFVLSLIFFVRGLRLDRPWMFAAGWAAAAAALMIRQFGLVLFIGFGCAYIFKKGIKLKRIATAVLFVVSGLGLQYFYQVWLRSTGRISAFYGNPLGDIGKIVNAGVWAYTVTFLKMALVVAIYSGMFLLPFLVLVAYRQYGSWSGRQRRWRVGFLVIFTGIMFIGFLRYEIWMPFTNNTMSEIGVGPLLLRDTTFGMTNLPVPLALRFAWKILTVLGIVGAGLIFEYLFLAARRLFSRSRTSSAPAKWSVALILVTSFIYFLTILPQTFFDRYLLPLWPLFCVLAVLGSADAGTERKARRIIPVSLILLILYGLFAVGATHDYLHWNRVRWDALDGLMNSSHVPPNRIDGGMEFNGWYLYKLVYDPKPGKSWWWVAEDDYSIAFGPIPGYQTEKSYRLNRRLPFGPAQILVLHKAPTGSLPK